MHANDPTVRTSPRGRIHRIVPLLLVPWMGIVSCGDSATEPPDDEPPPSGDPATSTLASISVMANATELIVGDTLQLMAMALATNGDTIDNTTFVWSSSKDTVASIEVSPDSLVLEVGEGGTLAAVAHDSTGAELMDRTTAWVSRDTAIATVSAAGAVKAVAPGTAWIVATTESVSDSARVTVIPRFNVTGKSLAAAFYVMCGLTVKGEAYCWGVNRSLGNNAAPDDRYHSTRPVKVAGGHRFVDIDADGEMVFAVTADGAAYTWGVDGSNGLMLFGVGSAVSFLGAPAPVAGGHRFQMISAGSGRTCGLTFDGEAYCWGYGDRGHLGQGTFESSNVPVKVAGGHRFVKISAGGDVTVALTESGEAWAWGYGHRAMGRGQWNDPSNVPVSLGSAHRFSDIAAGQTFVVALAADGTPYHWGQIGGDLLLSPAPMVIEGGHKFVAVSAGSSHVLARKANGELWAWGWNQYGPNGLGGGELGDGTNVNSSVPVRVKGGLYTDMVAGDKYSMAFGTDGGLYGWGFSHFTDARGLEPVGPDAPATGPSVSLGIDPFALSLQAGQTQSTTVTVRRTSGGFTTSGPLNIGALALSYSGSMAGVTITMPSSIPEDRSTFDLTVSASQDAPEGESNFKITGSSTSGVQRTTSSNLKVTISPPPPPPSPGKEFACPTENTALPTGYHCMAYQGAITAGKFSDTELHGTWVDEDVGVCLTWNSNGQGYGRYKAGNSVSQTPSGKWGAMINLDGTRFQNDRYWMIFTATADAQTNLLTYDAQTKTIVNWQFKKGACPF